MRIKFGLLLSSIFLINLAHGQLNPTIHITFSKLLATYDFVIKQSDYYPDNEMKKTFQTSKFYTPHTIDLVRQLDTLNLDESFDFQGYPFAQKIPFSSIFLVKKNLINAHTIEEFNELTFGVVPNADLFAFSHIISAFEPIYDSLIYLPNKANFESQLNDLKQFVNMSNLTDLFELGLTFYGASWDYSVPIEVAIIPSIKKNGFTATAFLNHAISEVPLGFKDNDILFSALMHEIYHNIYDGQPLQLKQNIQNWFSSNASLNSQYALLLLNEALATALGNGLVYELLNGKPDQGEWYHFVYINLMAREIYPLVKEYINNNKTIDKEFVDRYIAIYDKQFHQWINELDHIFSNRFVIADQQDDIDYLDQNYRSPGLSISALPINNNELEKMKETPVTKLIIISTDHKNKWKLVKSSFPELKSTFHAKKQFVITHLLPDKTVLIVINKHDSTLSAIFDKHFVNGKIKT